MSDEGLNLGAGAEGVSVPVALPTPVETPRRRGFAGFSAGQLLGGVAVLGALVWGSWATRELLQLREKRIVAVSLAAMANDFVMAEARSGNSPEQTDADTRHYMAALQSVLKGRAEKGETILVGEAVVSSSVPDITPEVREAVGKLITANPAPRVPAAMPTAPAAPIVPGMQAPPSGQVNGVMPSSTLGGFAGSAAPGGVTNGIGGN